MTQEQLIEVCAIHIVHECVENSISSQYYVSADDVYDFLRNVLKNCKDVDRDDIELRGEDIADYIVKNFNETVLICIYLDDERSWDIQVYDSCM